jgi:hypothetical protein
LRQKNVAIWPGSIFDRSTSVGRPAARALSDGFQEATKGHRGEDGADGAGSGGGGNQKLAPTLVDFRDGIAGGVIAHSGPQDRSITPGRVAQNAPLRDRREAAHYTQANQR